MMRRIAVVGDQLDTGGQIEPYAGPLFMWHGHQVVLIGGSAYCEVCKSIGVVAKSGGPRRLEFMGETAADGDIVLCKCSRPPRIVAKLAGESYCDDEAEAYAARAAHSAIANACAGANTTTPYDEQFTLHDADGSILADTYYTIRFPNGALVHGITDGAGRTERTPTDGAQRVAVYLGHRE